MAIDYAILVRDGLHRLGAADHSTYARMVETWYHFHPQTGEAQPPPPSEEECATLWPPFVEQYNRTATSLAEARTAGGMITPWQMRHYPMTQDARTGEWRPILLEL